MGYADIFITATANQHQHRGPHGPDEEQAIVCNIATPTTRSTCRSEETKGIGESTQPQYDDFRFRLHSVCWCLAEGRLLNSAARRATLLRHVGVVHDHVLARSRCTPTRRNTA